MNFETRLNELERRMETYESMKKKRKADVLEEESENDVDVEVEATGVVVGRDDFEEILKGVLRHSKPSGEFEWARKQIQLTQTDPADLDRYFTALVAALVVHGYVDSYTAWLNRFVVPQPPTGIFKSRSVEAYVSKNLLTMLNLQPLSRGNKAKDVALDTLKKRSTYEKILECARAVSRGETLTYEPSPAALQLKTCAPKKSSGGRKKKILSPPADKMNDDEPVEEDKEDKGDKGDNDEKGDDEPVEEGDDEEGEDEEGEDEEEDVFAFKGAMIGGCKAKDSYFAAQDASEPECEPEFEPVTQVQTATQVEPDVCVSSPTGTVEFERVDIFSMPTSSSSLPPQLAVPALSSSASSLRNRLMMKKSSPHPMMQESTPLEWEPLDVNRRSMVQTPTGAWDSYMSWRKAFEADPRFENRYVEYTRPNGDRSSLTGYYVRFFNAWPSIVSSDEIAVMSPQKADSMYVRWLQSLSTTNTTDSIREKLL